MRVLAVETSTLSGGAALLDGERVVGEYTLDVRLTHSERLMAAIDQLLIDAGWTVRELEGLAVSVGPGSFTGLRVGLSTVKALAIPVAAVPPLDAMAAMLPYGSLPVCPVLDARKREVYASLYRWDGRGMRREWDYLAVAPDDLARRLDEPVIVLGDGADAIRSPLAHRIQPPRRGPAPAVVGALGLTPLAIGGTIPMAHLAPIYLRPSEAELKRRGAAVS